MQISEPAPVVVAVNGNSAGLAATRLGAREAVASGRPLRIVHAFSWPPAFSPDDPPDYAVARQDADQLVRVAVDTALRSVPGVRVTGHVAEGDPVRVLLRRTRTAALLVIGDDGLAATKRLPPSSVLVQAVARARCPVVVARGVRPPAGPLLAAVDGSPCSLLALRFAAAEAVRLSAALEVTHVVGGPDGTDAGRALLGEAIATIGRTPRVSARLLTGDPAATLVRASRRARLLLAGPRGTRGPGLLGVVAAELLLRGACPTVFVHGTSAARTTPDGTLPTAEALIG